MSAIKADFCFIPTVLKKFIQKYLVIFSEEDETLEKTDVEYTVNDANVEPNCANDESIDNSFIFRDTDDQMSSELSDENDFDDDVEDDLGVSINCEFDDSEKGFHIMEKVCSVFRVPRYYVKRDPDPSEIIEVFLDFDFFLFYVLYMSFFYYIITVNHDKKIH